MVYKASIMFVILIACSSWGGVVGGGGGGVAGTAPCVPVLLYVGSAIVFMTRKRFS